MIKEVLVVEGKMDVAAVHRAAKADCIITGGFTLSRRTLNDIKEAYRRRGIIILTDPDAAGERIRRFLAQRFPEAKHAFIPREEAMANDDIGVADMAQARLSGAADAVQRRARLGAMLGVGFANAKTFLRRLNHYGVTREEFSAAVAALNEQEEKACAET